MRTTYRYFCAVLLSFAGAACSDNAVTPPSSPGSIAGMDLNPIEPVGPVEPPEEPPYAEPVPIYRWHKFADHLFGIDPNEGYPYGYTLDHSPSFYLFDTGPSYHYAQLFRCWRQNSLNQHFVTRSSSCEGEPSTVLENLDHVFVVRPGYQSSFPGVVPLFRVRFPGNGDDMVTISSSERDAVVANGWEYLGILGYVYP
jgi:hypothetical protein